MGSTAEVRMSFARERHARWAQHVAEEIIKLLYAPEDLPWAEEADRCPSLSQRYLEFREYASQLDPLEENPYCALAWIERKRTELVIERCQDIAGWAGIDDKEEFFPQLCFAYALRFPQVSFDAVYRYEMTVSGAVQLIRMHYDGKVMHVREISGMSPFDEDDWSRARVCDYAAEDGVFREQGGGGTDA